jgi:hypothetical protein
MSPTALLGNHNQAIVIIAGGIVMSAPALLGHLSLILGEVSGIRRGCVCRSEKQSYATNQRHHKNLHRAISFFCERMPIGSLSACVV